MQDGSSDEDDSDEEDDGETCAKSQKTSRFEFKNMETILPPVDPAVITAMAEKDVVRGIHDNLIELKQFFYEKKDVVEEVTQELEKSYDFLDKIAETLVKYDNPFMDEETKTQRDNELLIIIGKEHERLIAELVEEFQFSN